MELQRLELLGKTSLAIIKYLPLSAARAAEVARLLHGAQTLEPWSARAAALVFSQYFWFRHAFLLSPADYQSLKVCLPGRRRPRSMHDSHKWTCILMIMNLR